MNVIETPKMGISGKILSWEVINEDGSIDQSCYVPSSNIITDVGLDMLPTADLNVETYHLTYFCIGTGTATPSATDTTLTNETYRSTCAYAPYTYTDYSSAGSDPYYAYRYRGVQTTLGALNGTYGEIGFSQSATMGGTVFCKHRLVDEFSVPTTIHISSAQQLRLSYVLIYHMSPSTITTGTVNIDGIGDVGYTARWQKPTFYTTTGIFPFLTYTYPRYLSKIYMMPSTFTLGNIGVGHSTSSGISSVTTGSYVNGSHELYYTGTWSVSDANSTWYGVCLYNIGFTPTNSHFSIKFDTPFVKANTHTMSFTIKVCWARSE